MKSLMFLTGILGMLLGIGQAYAADGFPIDRKVQLERGLEDRVRAFLKPMDASIQATVEIVFKKKTVSLGGIGFNEVDPLALNPDHPWLQSSVSAVRVKIMSRRQQPDESLIQRVQDIAHVGTANPTVTWELWPDAASKNIDLEATNPQAFREMGQQLIAILEKSLDFLPLMFAAIFLLLSAVGIFSARSLGKSIGGIGNNILSLGSAIKAMGGDSPPRRNEIAEGQEPTRNRASQPSSQPNTELAAMGPALRSLLWDCYWCEQDGYAHWLWQRMGVPDKQRILTEDPAIEAYVRHFTSGPVSELGYHNHSYYLAPRDYSRTSQADMAKVIQGNPGLWAMLSPMRCDFIPLTLTERLRLLQAPPLSGPVPSLPASPARKLRGGQRVGTVTAEDEGILMKKPEMVPPELRAQLPSLVWLAVLPEERTAEILAKFSAVELAQAWTGHPTVLETLASRLPEKKWALVSNYVTKTKPSVHNSIYKQLCQFAIEGHLQNAGQPPSQKAA